jgi:hypothetical protein
MGKNGSQKQQKIDFSMDLLKNNPGGLKFSILHKELCKNFGLTNGAATGFIRDLFNNSKGEIIKPEKGLYKLSSYQNNLPNSTINIVQQTFDSISEKDFYPSFADWLIDEVGECSKAISLGGNKFGGKWGTPDVVGILLPSQTDIIKEIEFTSVEIKTDVNQLITAFGQACSYKLFSHRVYLVIPEQSNPEEIVRLDSLCTLFGIGLVLFNKTDRDNPNYQIRNRAQKGLPDNFYANINLKIIAKELGI